MRNMASSWMLKTREPEFQEMAEYTKNFREKMLAIETISDKIAKDRFGEKVHTFFLLFTCSSYFSLASVTIEMVEVVQTRDSFPCPSLTVLASSLVALAHFALIFIVFQLTA